MAAVHGVLSGLRVVEFEAIGPVPFAGMWLADMGAEVLRIDRTTAAADLGIRSHLAKVDVMGRGKCSLALDLKDRAARDQVQRIVARADVVLEGFRPGTLERLGLGPEVLLGANPKLVLGRMTGWGQDGPLAASAGHDINYIALSGLLSAIGERGRKPVPPLNLLGDFGGGGLLLALGVVSAVLAVQRGGAGQVVDVAMVEGAALLGTALCGLQAAGLWPGARGDNLLDGGAPWYDTYETSDARYMAVGALEDRFYAAFLDGLGLQPSDLPDRTDRAAWPRLRQRFADVFLRLSQREWCERFEGTDACVTPVLTMAEAAAHAQSQARQAFAEVDGVTLPAPAPKFMAHAARSPATAPQRGQGGAERLRNWGVSLEPMRAADMPQESGPQYGHT